MIKSVLGPLGRSAFDGIEKMVESVFGVPKTTLMSVQRFGAER